MVRTLLALTWAGMLGLTLPGLASAHDELVASTPADNEQLESAPEAVQFRFAEDVEAQFVTVAITDRDGHRFDHGQPVVDGAVVRVAARTPVPFGEYTAASRVVSRDRHVITRSIKYIVMPAAAVLHPDISAHTGAPAVAPSGIDARSLWPWAAGAIVLVAAGVLAARRSGRRHQ